MTTRFDLITVGRVSMDLFSQDIGADFADITGFVTAVGGSPTNIAIAGSRLGLRTAAFTAVGNDRVGEFVLRYLRDERVDTTHIPRKPGKLTPLALLGVQPPSNFPLSFYREDPPDIHLNTDDVDALPFAETRAVQFSGDAFNRGSCAVAARYAAEQANRAGLTCFMDLDLRPTEWTMPKAFGVAIRNVISMVDVAIGTEEEFYAALMPHPEAVINGAPVPDGEHAELDARVDELLRQGLSALVIKRGARGATVFLANDRIDVPGFPVEVLNTVGAGDAFAGGFIRSRLRGLDWYDSVRFGNACGAITVTRHGCAAAFPTQDEIEAFVAHRGGW
jgi:5-dehydro-2-deoxygluconokinase